MDGEAMNWHDYIHSDASVLVGKPIIKGTRLSVEILLGLMAEGWTKNRFWRVIRSSTRRRCKRCSRLLPSARVTKWTTSQNHICIPKNEIPTDTGFTSESGQKPSKWHICGRRKKH